MSASGDSGQQSNPDQPVDPQGLMIQTSGLYLVLGGNKVLSDISLSFLPGQISAVLGPSGSGKSTLIKCITTVFKPSQGRVTVDGQDLWQIRGSFRPLLGYVPQDDIIHRELRVEQAFSFAARLRLDTDVPQALRTKLIDRIIGQLGLAAHRRKRIARLSGGQRKRVNIGIELIADPRVLILDEPASGLDPGTEEDLLGILRRLAQQGKTVITTTHSMEFLDQVDRVVVLMDGAMIFSGTLATLLDHFQIPHVADVFKTIRKNSTAQWVTKWKSRGK